MELFGFFVGSETKEDERIKSVNLFVRDYDFVIIISLVNEITVM